MIDGMQWGLSNFYKTRYRFQNGYGASIVWNPASYGHEEYLFELAVLDENDDLCYDTPVTSDVIGGLDFFGVVEKLEEIKALPPRSSVRDEESKLILKNATKMLLCVDEESASPSSATGTWYT